MFLFCCYYIVTLNSNNYLVITYHDGKMREPGIEPGQPRVCNSLKEVDGQGTLVPYLGNEIY